MLALMAGQGAALRVAGTAEGAGPASRIGAFAVTPYGQPVQEMASASVEAGRFRLEVPAGPPSDRAQTSLTPRTVSWPGVIDPVVVSGEAQTSELKFFAYRDVNDSGRHDAAELLREVTPHVGKSTLFVVWVNTEVTVRAGKGYEATLKRGWNAFVVDVGRGVRVQPFTEDRFVHVRLSR